MWVLLLSFGAPACMAIGQPPLNAAHHHSNCSFLLQVTEGSWRMLVLAVGENSEWGRTMALVVGEVGSTPLQEKLGWLATAIGKLGFVVAVVCFLVLLIR